MFLGLDHGIASVRASGGPLTPFLLEARGADIAMTRFAAETLEEGIERARQAAAQSGPSVTAAALVHDGYLSIGEQRYDAVLVEAQAAGTLTADVFAQCYRFEGGELQEIGNPKHVAIDQPPLLG